jgi:hypothetical protein
MNYLRTITALLLALALSLPVATAQNSFDVNRMNRDLNIMENILQEMFKTQRIGSGDTHVFVGVNSLFRSGNIRGTYLPDFGVIFLIPDSRTSFFSFGHDNDEETSLAFVYRGDSGNDTKLTEESIVQRIKEFLRDYGSTIGQLSPDDKVMVLYGANRDGFRREALIVAAQGSEAQMADKVNTISVVASKQNLDAYRSGKIPAEEFDRRVSVSKVDSEDKKHLDMEVLSNIFETALGDHREEGFRIRGSVNHLLLDNFGALFFFDASYSQFGNVFFVRTPTPSRTSHFDSAERRAQVEVRNKIITEQQEEMSEGERKEELEKAYSSFVDRLKEYLVDYGRTLNSVKSDQMVLLSVSLNSHNDALPERIDIQIKKSVLESMDKGDISRKDALNQVVVREY